MTISVAMNPSASAVIQTDFHTLSTESLQLQNRLGRLVDMRLRCLSYRGRIGVILVSSPSFPARQMSNSCEHLAHQLVKCLAVEPEQVDFIQYQPGAEPEWLRWRFQWVGLSPLQGQAQPMSTTAIEGFLRPLLEDGNAFSLAVTAAVA